MLKIAVYSLAAMLGLFSGSLFAEGGAYQIELIVFTQSMPTSEVFDQLQQPTQWPSDLTELSAYKKPDTAALDDSFAALSKEPVYKPILHVTWIQPTVGEGGLSAPVRIQGAEGKLNGYVQMQGLQLTVDLEFAVNSGDGSDKASSSSRPVGKPAVYRLNEKRSIKLNEVHYFDHPKLGVVIKISPL